MVFAPLYIICPMDCNFLFNAGSKDFFNATSVYGGCMLDVVGIMMWQKLVIHAAHLILCPTIHGELVVVLLCNDGLGKAKSVILGVFV